MEVYFLRSSPMIYDYDSYGTYLMVRKKEKRKKRKIVPKKQNDKRANEMEKTKK